MRTLVLLLIVCCFSAYSFADVVLVNNNGLVNAAIYLGANPSDHAKLAATELQSYLEKISGAKLEILTTPPAGNSRCILVGQDAAAAEAAKLGVKIPSGVSGSLDDEGYVIAAQGNVLLLAGNETEPYQGTEYAVADFLESLGCRWYFPGEFGEVTPKIANITVKPGVRVVRPDFRVRDVWYSGHLVSTTENWNDFIAWKRHNRLTRAGFWTQGEIYFQNPTDDSAYKLLPKDVYYDAHPEYYALRTDGTRDPNFLCVSNPDAVQASADTVIKYFKDNPQAHSFAFSPPDAPVLCHCPDCLKAMNLNGFGGEGNGNISDPWFNFAIKLADMVGKVYPDKYIITMSYYNRCRPPEGSYGQRKNLLIQYAFIQECGNHTFETANCPTRDVFAGILTGWSKLASGLVAYDYDPHDWNHSQKPFWRSQGVAADMRFAKKIGGWGYSDEGMMAWLVTGLNYYVRGKLAWDLNQDVTALENDFFSNFFGPASAPMKSYYTGIEKALADTPLHITSSYTYDDVFAVLDAKVMDDARKQLADAAALAKTEPYATRVAAFRGHFKRLDSARKALDDAANGRFADAIDSAQGMLDAVKEVNDPMLLQDAGPWGGSCSGQAMLDFTKELAAMTDGTNGNLLAVLPETAYARTDPGKIGVVHKWYLSDAPFGGKPLSTKTSWYNQGFITPEGERYNGVAWYRTRVKLAATPAEKVTVLMPYVKGQEVWMWVNGKFVGYATRADKETTWNRSGLRIPAAGLFHQGDNLVVFRVNGSGGFVLPPVIIE